MSGLSSEHFAQEQLYASHQLTIQVPAVTTACFSHSMQRFYYSPRKNQTSFTVVHKKHLFHFSPYLLFASPVSYAVLSTCESKCQLFRLLSDGPLLNGLVICQTQRVSVLYSAYQSGDQSSFPAQHHEQCHWP